jgi:aspartyl protease family protein
MRGKDTWIALVILGLVLLLVLLNYLFPGSLDSQNTKVNLAYSVALLVLVGSSVLLGRRGNATLALKQAVAWLGIFIAIIVLYSFRAEFQQIGARVSGELVPTRPTSGEGGTITLHRGQSGHYVVDGRVNGKIVRFLVDTGASDVALTVADAERAGIDTRFLDFNKQYNTANGLTMGASIRLQEVTIGHITLYDVRASVMPNGLGTSLLGMSYLNRLSSYEARGNELILRQ